MNKLSKMALNISSKVTLNNGCQIPIYGLGTYLITPGDHETVNTLKYALDVSKIELFDTAQFYQNENEVGEAVKASAVPRERAFIVSKLWDTKDGKEGAVSVIENSLKLMDVDYIDLYLIHSPIGGKVIECYDVLIEYQKKGILKSIGVSNFGVEHLKALKNSGRPLPQVNQIQLHPWWRLQHVVDWCQLNNIAVMGYCPLVRGRKFDHPLIIRLSAKYKKTPAQILVRWSLQKGFITIPKSNKPHRIDENSNVFDFHIDEEDMERFEEFANVKENVCSHDSTNNDIETHFGPRY